MTGLRGLALTVWQMLVSESFRLLYNEMAWAYDAVSQLASLGRWRRWQQVIWPYLPAHGRVLEVAAGPGHLLVALARAGLEVTGLDRSPAMLSLARRRLLKAGLPDQLIRGEATTLPLADKAVDLVVATFPTAFVRQSQWAEEAHRVLRPGGRLVIVDMARFDQHTLAARSLEWLYRITGQREPAPDLPTLLRQAGFAAWRDVAKVAGTTVSLVLAEKRAVPIAPGQPEGEPLF